MTFNICHWLAEDGVNRWENHKSLVLDRIRACDPDLLGLQECRDDSQAEYIRFKRSATGSVYSSGPYPVHAEPEWKP